MARSASIKFLLPGIFLLVLGLGNFIVGSYKVVQYEEVVRELSVIEPTPVIGKRTTLARMQTAKKISDRFAQRQAEAQNRLSFYKLVSFGGKTFVGISLVLFLISALFRLVGISRETGIAQTT